MIVESPAKARTISKFLGSSYQVESSIGHVRDLPRSAADIPAAYKGTGWARLGVDVDNDFKPLYLVAKEKKQQITKLKGLLKDANELYLATDEDREGESIAWHLLEVLNPKVPVRRMVFHEITREAIEHAISNPRELDRRLVDAQEARRILDRLYGYEVSPVLWKKVAPRLSAGRVQSVATRIIVDRERDRMSFVSASYWDLSAQVSPVGSNEIFGSKLTQVEGKRVASGKDFTSLGQLKSESVVLDEAAARALAEGLAGANMEVRSLEEKPQSRKPAAPFMTSTLQQEAGRKLRFSSSHAMRVAQRLYEGGYITYMRTDSTNLSSAAVGAARKQAEELYGREYVSANERVYNRKVKNAQEAHEAIRPAGDFFRTPAQVRSELAGDELALYELIWKRTVASQMADARLLSVQAKLATKTSDGRDLEFSASGRTILFPGFLRAYVEGSDDPEAALDDREAPLPKLEVGQRLDLHSVSPEGHATQPPARYTEASLVKALEELGVGRPSTYASVIQTIQDRGYVWKKSMALVPSLTAFAVVGLMEQHFTNLVDYEFTARMEDDLDQIASGNRESIPWLKNFYFGGEGPGLQKLVSDQMPDIDAREINSFRVGVDEQGNEIVARVGRYGPFVARGEERASLPEDVAPDELTVERALEILSAPSQDRVLGTDPQTGLEVSVLNGRFGPYVQLGSNEDSEGKPPRSSLFKSMDPSTVTLNQALELLSLPRVVGAGPDGAEIVALNGRFGPYLKMGDDTRTLDTEDQLLSCTVEQALEIFAQPKRRRGQSAAAGPLKTLGEDPASGKPMVVKSGRFGPYVTDGEVNASLPRGLEVEDLDDRRAIELLASRRERIASGEGGRRPAKKTTAKKAAKKTTAKKAAKKAPVKKSVGKKRSED